jgi:hypothetical protein
LILVLLASCSAGTTPTNASRPAPRNPDGLTWAPPQCGGQEHGCVDLYLRNTGSHQTPVLNNNTDYRIHLPANGPLVGGVTITAGRNVQIIGGQIDLTYPCSNDESDCMGIYIAKNSPGAVFVEGVWIRNPSRIGRTCPGGASSTSQTCSTGDGIDVNTANNGVINVNTITLENIRVDGISGCSGYGDHSDVFQPYQAPDATIRIDHMTGVTNCQGLQLDPDLAYSAWHTFPSSIRVQNANVGLTINPYRGRVEGYTWWLTFGTDCQSGPISLSDDYAGGPRTDPTAARVWPDPANDVCGARYSHSVFSWADTDAHINGSIRSGAPPGGDFVPVGAVGLSYRSPGYR